MLDTFKNFSYIQEEILTEGVPSKVMDEYENWLGGNSKTDPKGKIAGSDYGAGAPYVLQGRHFELMTLWYTLDVHWVQNRPWKVTEKGTAIHERVMKNLKKQVKDSAFGGEITDYHINDSIKYCIKVWNACFNSKEFKKSMSADKVALDWNQAPRAFGVDVKKNLYGDFGNPLTGEGFYLKQLMSKKMVVKTKPSK